jgi:hypothetical protein
MSDALELEITGWVPPEPGAVLGAAMATMAVELVAFLEGETKRRTPVGVTEAARGSIAGSVRRGVPVGRGVELGTLGSPLLHVLVVDRGRKPGGRPPPVKAWTGNEEALDLWVRRKLKVTDEKEAVGVALAIARRVAARGTKGVRMFERAVTENSERIAAICAHHGFDVGVRYAAAGRRKGGTS